MSILDIEKDLQGRNWSANPNWRDDYYQTQESDDETLQYIQDQLKTGDLTYEEKRYFSDYLNEDIYPYLDSWVWSDQPTIDRVRRYMGIEDNRTDESWLSKMRYRDQDQFLGKVQYDREWFNKLAEKGLLVHADGSPITEQELSASRKFEGGNTVPRGRSAQFSKGIFEQYQANPDAFKLTQALPQLLDKAAMAEQLVNELGAQTLEPGFHLGQAALSQFGYASKSKFEPQLYDYGFQRYVDNNVKGEQAEKFSGIADKIYVDENSGMLYYAVSKDNFTPEYLKNDEELLNLISNFDPSRYEAYLDSLQNENQPYQNWMFKDYSHSIGDQVFLPLSTTEGGGQKQFSSTITGGEQGENWNQILGQPGGAVLFELLPGIGMFSGVWKGAKTGSSVVGRGGNALAKEYGIPLDVAEKIELTRSGNFTPASLKLLEKHLDSRQLLKLQGIARVNAATTIDTLPYGSWKGKHGEGKRGLDVDAITRTPEDLAGIERKVFAWKKNNPDFNLSPDDLLALQDHIKHIKYNKEGMHHPVNGFLTTLKNTRNAAAKFNPEDPDTWHGVVQMVGDKSRKTKIKDHRGKWVSDPNGEVIPGNWKFVYGSDEAKQFFMKKYNETKTGRKPGPEVQKEYTQKELAKDFGFITDGMTESQIKTGLGKMQTVLSYERGRALINSIDAADQATLFGVKYEDSGTYFSKSRAGFKLWADDAIEKGKTGEIEKVKQLIAQVQKYNKKHNLIGTPNQLEIEHLGGTAHQYDQFMLGNRELPPDFSVNNVQVVPAWKHRSGHILGGANQTIDPKLGEKTKGFLIEGGFKGGGGTIKKLEELEKLKLQKNPNQSRINALQKEVDKDLDTLINFSEEHSVYADFSEWKGILPDDFINNKAFKKPEGYDPIAFMEDLLTRDHRRYAGLIGEELEDNSEKLPDKPYLFASYLMNKMDKPEMDDRFEELSPELQRKIKFLDKENKTMKLLAEHRIDPPDDTGVRFERIEPGIKNIEDLKARVAEEMVEKKPVKVPWSSIPKLITQNPLLKKMIRTNMMPTLMLQSILFDAKEKGVDTEKELPKMSKFVKEYFDLGPTPATDPEAAYIDGISEFNRALETGMSNLGYNTMDLVLSGIDLSSFGKTDLSGRLREMYEKRDINEPETFVGDMVSLLVEFGVPGGVITKILSRAQKALRLKGVNTMTRFIDDDTVGYARFGMQFSNVAKRMGTGAVIFGVTDFVGGGPYNSLYRMFPEDPTLLPGKPIDTTNLNGNELALANFKNRLRFAGDGAMIGGLFPLLGPPVWGITKGIVKLPFRTIPGVNRSLFGGALQLAGIPLKIATDALAGKVPYTQHTIPLLGKGMQTLGKWGASGIQQTAAFLGKQVFSRAALGIYDLAAKRQALYSGIDFGATFKRSLPKFEEWRRFSVNSQDPLHQYLAKLDNTLAHFRDIGKLGKDMFGLMGQKDLFIKARSRAIDKFLKNIETTAYRMAKTFEDRHKKWGEFETIQKKYLDDVLDYLQGNLKLENLPKKLAQDAKALKEYVSSLKEEFKGMLPKDDPLHYLLAADIDKYMRRSFSMFTNSTFQPGKEAVMNAKNYIKDLIRGNNQLHQEATQYFPKLSINDAIEEYAQLKVGDIMHTARYEMEDPFKALQNIVSKKLGLEDIVVRTGEEVPEVIRKLLGEEKNLKSSLLQTTGNIISSTQQKLALDQIAKMGKSGGWLFDTAEEALAKGKIFNAHRLNDIKGAGFVPSDILGMYGTPEVVKQLSGYSIFDSALKYKVYQNLLAFKAMVQGGKTLYSPATQMRNFGSASLFALNVGHIGGSASVPQAMKMVLDDIFGAGPKSNRNELIKYIERKVELGVTDENVVANELAGILADLKGTRSATGEPIISSFNQLLQKVGTTKMSQYVQRTYAGGDNVWKIYGHEFYMSELKQFTKTIDDVKAYFNNVIGREFIELSPKTGVKKTVAEGIEEMGAFLVRETYPTYSRVPPVVQALRKIPLGNFISFPAEMLRTSATTLSLSLKHIASGNPGLQAMGYRALFGQFTTLYGMNEAISQIASAVSGVSEDKLQAYLDDLGPAFMSGHKLIPLGPQDPETGIIKAFDMSTYNPYAYVTDPVEGFIRELNKPRMMLDIDGEVYNRIFDAGGPVLALLEPFMSEAIALEPFFDVWARQGRTRTGKLIFSPTDDFGEKVGKSFNHAVETLAPGFIRSAGQVWGALKLDTQSGRVMQLGDVLIKLLGGSVLNVDPVSALDYKAIDIREIRSNAFKTEHFFSKENALERGPAVMAAEFRDVQTEALQAQFDVWKMFQRALKTGLLTEEQILEVLGPDGRNVPNIDNLIDGYFTPVSYSASGLEKRANELEKEYKRNGIKVNWSDLYPEFELDDVIYEFEDLEFEDLIDQHRKGIDQITPPGGIQKWLEERLKNRKQNIKEQQTEPLNFPTPIVTAQSNMGTTPDPQTGLTRTETALLSPSEKLIQQRQRGTV